MEQNQGTTEQSAPFLPQPTDDFEGRPGCLTLLAVYLGISGILSAASTAFLLRDGLIPSILGGAIILIALVGLPTAYGIWLMRPFGRILAMVVFSANLLIILRATFVEVLPSGEALGIMQSILGVVATLYVIWWFFASERHFKPSQKS